MMKIAVTSQNFRTVTGHAGKTRRFLIYEADGEEIREMQRLDLPRELSFHELPEAAGHPIDSVDVLITASCGDHFRSRLARRGVRVLATGESNPERAVRLVSIGGTLPPPEPREDHGSTHWGGA